MKTFAKYATAAGLAGALALAAAVPSQARHWHGGVGAGIGFAAGAVVGAAVASAANGYYYGAPGYYYGPGYYYAPDAYDYEPAPVYRGGRCWHVTDSDRGFGYYGACPR